MDSPVGQQFGVLVVPKQFVIEALSEFPSLITRLTEGELEDFWDNRAFAHLENVKRDEQALTNLERERVLIDDALIDATGKTKTRLTNRKAALRNEVIRALDPDDPMPGIRSNHRKKWADWKVKNFITIQEA